MDKNKVLTFAQKEGELGIDEGSAYVTNRGLRYGMSLIYALFIVFFLTSIFSDQPLPGVVWAFFVAPVVGDFLSRWRDNKKPLYLVLFIIAFVTLVLSAILGVQQLIGIR